MDICLAIIATICLSDANLVRFEKSAPASATVDFNEGSMRVQIELENGAGLDRSRLAKICEGEVCIAYYKHCAGDRQSYSCLYAATEVNGSKEVVFSVTAPTKAKLQAIEQTLGIVGRSLGQEAVIPLTAFERTFYTNRVPYCGDEKSRC